MKILVIENEPNHIATALQTLGSHELTFCTDYNEIDKYPFILEIKHDEKKIDELRLKKLEPVARAEAFKEAELPYWDAVLCTFIMPATFDGCDENGVDFEVRECAVGVSVALQAAVNGAKYVAVASSMSAHTHVNCIQAWQSTKLLDPLYEILTVNGARMWVSHLPPMVKILGTENKGKDWGKILNMLIHNNRLLYSAT